MKYLNPNLLAIIITIIGLLFAILSFFMVVGKHVNMVTNQCDSINYVWPSLYFNVSMDHEKLQNYTYIRFNTTVNVASELPTLSDPYICETIELYTRHHYINLNIICSTFNDYSGDLCTLVKYYVNNTWLPNESNMVFFDPLSSYSYFAVFNSYCTSNGSGFGQFIDGNKVNQANMNKIYENMVETIKKEGLCQSDQMLAVFNIDFKALGASTLALVLGTIGIGSLIAYLKRNLFIEYVVNQIIQPLNTEVAES